MLDLKSKYDRASSECNQEFRLALTENHQMTEIADAFEIHEQHSEDRNMNHQRHIDGVSTQTGEAQSIESELRAEINAMRSERQSIEMVSMCQSTIFGLLWHEPLSPYLMQGHMRHHSGGEQLHRSHEPLLQAVVHE